MRYITVLVGILAIVGLGQALPKFGPQHTELEKELMDFIELIPTNKAVEIITKYMNEDKKMQEAIQYLFNTEFHALLREIEALKEHQDVVVYLEKAGLRVIQGIKEFHKVIGMGDYVPPKILSIFESQIGIQKIGDGMKGMLEDLYNILPVDKIDALYKEKLQNSKVFADFVGKLTSPEMQQLINNLYANQVYKNFVAKTRERGLELQELKKFTSRIFGLKFPY
ncbi:uncharacterized protein LOC105834828 [Monomorium pharaonis]|uniref:uncharacterized protein LOC105834828 n=1 Tax=Monomorium pharaonis TaxID=307658 RepID=UPI001746823D|nr:uncharacterized protein LOC105834828 [Monomorium pharaonis]